MRTTLDRVPVGRYAQICCLPSSPELRRYLKRLGLTEGVWVWVTYNPWQGPVVVRVHGRRVVVSREAARGLAVRVSRLPWPPQPVEAVPVGPMDDPLPEWSPHGG